MQDISGGAARAKESIMTGFFGCIFRLVAGRGEVDWQNNGKEP